MKLNKTIITFLCLLLIACQGQQATPFLDVTTTPMPAVTQRFTARIVVGAVNVIREDTLYVSAMTIKFKADAQGNVTSPTEFTSPLCYSAPGDVCKTEGANDLLVSGVMLSVESGCWEATKTGDDYTAPALCSP